MFTTTIRRGIVAAFAAALLLTACGTSDETVESGGVASLEEPAENSSESGAEDSNSDGESESDGKSDASDDPELAFAQYDECMADAGFDFGSSFGTGEPGEDGTGVMVQEFEIESDGDPQQSGLDGADFGDDFMAAEEECSKFLEGLDISFDMSPQEQAAMEDAQLAWTECMRENGIDVPDFDPSSGGEITIVGGPEDGSDPQTGGINGSDFDFEAFEEANETCNQVFDDAFGGGDAVSTDSVGS